MSYWKTFSYPTDWPEDVNSAAREVIAKKNASKKMTTDCMSWSDDFADLQSAMLTAIHKHNHDIDPTSTGSDHCRMWLDLPTLM
jgi:hypothetical protein